MQTNDPMRFSDQMPECRWFAFVDPEDTSRWIVGWKDWYHIREEGGASYRHGDPRLTWWYPLPDIPKSDGDQQKETITRWPETTPSDDLREDSQSFVDSIRKWIKIRFS